MIICNFHPPLAVYKFHVHSSGVYYIHDYKRSSVCPVSHCDSDWLGSCLYPSTADVTPWFTPHFPFPRTSMKYPSSPHF